MFDNFLIQKSLESLAPLGLWMFLQGQVIGLWELFLVLMLIRQPLLVLRFRVRVPMTRLTIHLDDKETLNYGPTYQLAFRGRQALLSYYSSRNPSPHGFWRGLARLQAYKDAPGRTERVA